MSCNRESFAKRLLDAYVEYTKAIFERYGQELGEAIKNDLFDLDGPREVKREYLPRDYFVAALFKGFTEIDESFKTLEDIEFYVRRFPFSGTRVTKERYLQFNVECYYSETFVIRERLTSYLKLISRRYRRDPTIPKLEAICRRLEETVSKTLEGLTKARSQHVHEARLHDPDIARIRMVSILRLAPDPRLKELMSQYHRELHREAKKKWSRAMKTNNTAIGKLLDVFFGSLEALLFDAQSKELRYPRRLDA